MICSNDTGVVSWDEDEGAASYTVQAFGPDGHKTGCVSTETSCQLPNLHCGQLYNLTLTALDGECDNSRAYLNLQSGNFQFIFTHVQLSSTAPHRTPSSFSVLLLSHSAVQPHQREGFSAVPLQLCCSDVGASQRSGVLCGSGRHSRQTSPD